MDEKNILDCRGLTCPEPVVRAKKHIQGEQPDEIAVVVDNRAALENVTRLLGSQGYIVSSQAEGRDWRVTGLRSSDTQPALGPQSAFGQDEAACRLEKVCVVISSEVFGSGDDELGGKLMKNFLATLPEFGESLWLLILLNGGVKLAAQGSPVLEQLEALKQGGCGILVCGTCLEHFGLMEKRALGETTNMMDVVTSMQLADKVIKL